MFTGIIETIGQIRAIEREGSNVHFTVASSFSDQLKIDQSVSHNGVCLTAVALSPGVHRVTAIQETLDRSNLGTLSVGDRLNLERAAPANIRLDGHIVQGHVDATGVCVEVVAVDGSWYYTFQFPAESAHLLVDKGSVAVNGVSLTVVEPDKQTFKVAIIPFTYEHTNFQYIQAGTRVNLEFDIIGKYIARYAELYFAKK